MLKHYNGAVEILSIHGYDNGTRKRENIVRGNQQRGSNWAGRSLILPNWSGVELRLVTRRGVTVFVLVEEWLSLVVCGNATSFDVVGGMELGGGVARR